MKIRFMSDLHCEFYQDQGKTLIESLSETDADVLVLAGDIAVGRGIAGALGWFSEKFPDVRILYIHGNHEFYRSNYREVKEVMDGLSLPNVTWMENDIVEIGGQRFLGTTLWYISTPLMEMQKSGWSDFRLIGSPGWIPRQGAMAVEWLEANLQEGDVVLTHMLPSPDCVSPRWKEEATNSFFVNDVTDLIVERKPKLWIHGHTHDSRDVVIGDTRVVCNPCGYPHDYNFEFDNRLTIEI